MKSDPLSRVLSQGRASDVVDAARRIAQEQLGMLDELEAAYFRIAEGGPRADPGCLAKLALLDALDVGEALSEQTFAHAIDLVQFEASKQHKRDSAGMLRARAALALARLNAAGLLQKLGGLLADALPAVRQNAAKAVAHYGNPDGAGLLLLRLKIGDEPSIELECLQGLFTLAPSIAIACTRELLRNADSERRELLASALGSANHDDAIQLLGEQLDESVVASERKIWIDALALSRRASARQRLLDVIEDGSQADARAAIGALAPHGYDARLVASVHEAAERRGDETLIAHARASLR
ncbi:MAG: HEAT repeat domain-containing protein [Polyangiales bacterium]